MAASSEVQVNSGDDSGVSACSTSTVLDIAAGEPWFGGWLDLMALVVVVVVGWCKDFVVFGYLLGWLDGTWTSCMGFNFRVSTVVVV